jgi:hypothetical protein
VVLQAKKVREGKIKLSTHERKTIVVKKTGIQLEGKYLLREGRGHH